MNETKFTKGHVDIVFDGPPGPVSGHFIEVENDAGESICFGEWIEREDGMWCLRIYGSSYLIAAAPKMYEALAKIVHRGILGEAVGGDVIEREVDLLLAKARGEA